MTESTAGIVNLISRTVHVLVASQICQFLPEYQNRDDRNSEPLTFSFGGSETIDVNELECSYLSDFPS